MKNQALGQQGRKEEISNITDQPSNMAVESAYRLPPFALAGRRSPVNYLSGDLRREYNPRLLQRTSSLPDDSIISAARAARMSSLLSQLVPIRNSSVDAYIRRIASMPGSSATSGFNNSRTSFASSGLHNLATAANALDTAKNSRQAPNSSSRYDYANRVGFLASSLDCQISAGAREIALEKLVSNRFLAAAPTSAAALGYDHLQSSFCSNVIDANEGSASREYIYKVREEDVLCGRGGQSNHHWGNKKYRQVVSEMKAGYRDISTKTEKTDLSKAIVDHVLEYGGRFLRKDPNNGRWYVLSKNEARKKTSQALRETKKLKWTL